MARRPPDRLSETAGEPSASEQQVLRAFIDMHHHRDVEGALALLRDDVRVTMPPNPYLFEGRVAMRPLMDRAFSSDQFLDWRLVPARANRQPAAISYALLPGDTVYRPFKLDVLRVESGLIREITTFDPRLIAGFDFPDVLPEDPGGRVPPPPRRSDDPARSR